MAHPAAEGATRRGRLTLALIAALFALPAVLAWLVHSLGHAPGGTSNYGTLVGPRAVAAAPVAALRGRWVLVQLDGGACGARCEQKLYYMRQVRLAMGKDAGRVERLWLVTDAAPPRAELLRAIQGTRLARADIDLSRAFDADGAATEHIFVVDPLGNLMLRFPRDPDPGKMIRDLERLLKYSSIG